MYRIRLSGPHNAAPLYKHRWRPGIHASKNQDKAKKRPAHFRTYITWNTRFRAAYTWYQNLRNKVPGGTGRGLRYLPPTGRLRHVKKTIFPVPPAGQAESALHYWLPLTQRHYNRNCTARLFYQVPMHAHTNQKQYNNVLLPALIQWHSYSHQ